MLSCVNVYEHVQVMYEKKKRDFLAEVTGSRDLELRNVKEEIKSLVYILAFISHVTVMVERVTAHNKRPQTMSTVRH